MPDEPYRPRTMPGVRFTRQATACRRWGDLFNARQKLALITFADGGAARARQGDAAQGAAPDFARARDHVSGAGSR